MGSPGNTQLAALVVAVAACGAGTSEVASTRRVVASPAPSTTAATSTPEGADAGTPVERVLDLGQSPQATAPPVVALPPPITVVSFGQPLPAGSPISLALNAIASTLGSCKRPGGRTGSGRALILFQLNGTVSAVEFVSGSFNGTDVGGCILQRFRGARIPRFTGSAVPVQMDFVL